MFSPLHYISRGETAAGQFNDICAALDSGCQWIQLRFKNGPTRHITCLAAQIRTRCTAYGATLVINDHPLVARIAEADGVHLGLNDMTVNEAREIVGPDKIIGGTAHTLDDVLQRVEEGCNYIVLGPLRFTSAKEKRIQALGVPGYQAILCGLARRGISIPIYASGGVIPDDIPALLQTGVYGVAVAGLITRPPDNQALITVFNSQAWASSFVRYGQNPW